MPSRPAPTSSGLPASLQTFRSRLKAAVNWVFTKYSMHSRAKKAAKIADFMAETGSRAVLSVGVHARKYQRFENQVEAAIQSKADFFVASGKPEGDVEGADWNPYVVADGCHLPFADDAFDMVVSNAVIEHVGDADRQRLFVAEHLRTARNVVITTPNRWFPVESHTQVLLLHWWAKWREHPDRQKLFTRLLSKSEFKELLQSPMTIDGGELSPTFLARYSREAVIDLTVDAASKPKSSPSPIG